YTQMSQKRIVALIAPEIAALPGIDQLEAVQLFDQQIRSLNSLWSAIGHNYPTGVSDLAEKTGINEKHLREIIAEQGIIEAKIRGEPWRQRHTMGLLSLELMLLLGFFFLLFS